MALTFEGLISTREPSKRPRGATVQQPGDSARQHPQRRTLMRKFKICSDSRVWSKKTMEGPITSIYSTSSSKRTCKNISRRKGGSSRHPRMKSRRRCSSSPRWGWNKLKLRCKMLTLKNERLMFRELQSWKMRRLTSTLPRCKRRCCKVTIRFCLMRQCLFIRRSRRWRMSPLPSSSTKSATLKAWSGRNWPSKSSRRWS